MLASARTKAAETTNHPLPTNTMIVQPPPAGSTISPSTPTTTQPTTIATTATSFETGATMAATPTRTTITSDPGILCFHHCNVKVFCFTLPHICPNCKTELDATPTDSGSGGNGNIMASMGLQPNGISSTSNSNNIYGCGLLGPSKLLPFRLPYPFVRASQYPCAIVLRPSLGDFLNDYNNATDLHIAVTTSTGSIVEFDRHGLRRHRRPDTMAEWRQCLLVGDVPEAWYDYWDKTLLQTCKQPSRWTVDQYIENAHNCYTFVLAFLQALAYDALSEAARSKTAFCERYIVPRTTTAGKYISLYRKLRSTGMYVHRSSSATSASSSSSSSASLASVSASRLAGKPLHMLPPALQHAKTKRGRLLGGSTSNNGGVKGTYSAHVSLTAPPSGRTKNSTKNGYGSGGGGGHATLAVATLAMPITRISTLCTIEE